MSWFTAVQTGPLTPGTLLRKRKHLPFGVPSHTTTTAHPALTPGWAVSSRAKRTTFKGESAMSQGREGEQHLRSGCHF